jgi:hypothetical protein
MCVCLKCPLFSYVMLCSLSQHFGEHVTSVFMELHHPVERLCHKGLDKIVLFE